jgi:hypothetical protein
MRRKEVVMRRLAVPAAFACLLTVAGLALPSTVLADDLVAQDASCPRGPRTVASHTGLEQTRDGLAVSIQFALEAGCDDVDVSLLRYHFTAGPGSGGHADQVLYDIQVARASAGQVHQLQVDVMPECWSLTKLVVGRPPAGAGEPGRGAAEVRAWERRNTVYSKWGGGASACAPPGSSLDAGGLLDSLLQPLGSSTPDDPALGSAQGPPPVEEQPGQEAQSQPGTSQSGSPSATTPPATGPEANGSAEPEPAPGASAGEEPADQDQAATDSNEDGGQEAEGLAAPSGGEIAGGDALPLTGTPVGNLLLAGVGLVMAGAALLRLGRRYRARHLAS